MTKGDPVRQIVKFMIPMLIGNVFQQLYNTVDSIVVGKYIGDNALAAVGSASPVLNLLLVLFIAGGLETKLLLLVSVLNLVLFFGKDFFSGIYYRIRKWYYQQKRRK